LIRRATHRTPPFLLRPQRLHGVHGGATQEVPSGPAALLCGKSCPSGRPQANKPPGKLDPPFPPSESLARTWSASAAWRPSRASCTPRRRSAGSATSTSDRRAPLLLWRSIPPRSCRKKMVQGHNPGSRVPVGIRISTLPSLGLPPPSDLDVDCVPLSQGSLAPGRQAGTGSNLLRRGNLLVLARRIPGAEECPGPSLLSRRRCAWGWRRR